MSQGQSAPSQTLSEKGCLCDHPVGTLMSLSVHYVSDRGSSASQLPPEGQVT